MSTELNVPEPEEEPWLDDVGADEELDPGWDWVWDWVWLCDWDWPLGPASSDMMFSHSEHQEHDCDA